MVQSLLKVCSQKNSNTATSTTKAPLSIKTVCENPHMTRNYSHQEKMQLQSDTCVKEVYFKNFTLERLQLRTHQKFRWLAHAGATSVYASDLRPCDCGVHNEGDLLPEPKYAPHHSPLRP